jgi:hypothetical protein
MKVGFQTVRYTVRYGNIISKKNPTFELRWWARLEGNRAKNLRSLFRNYELTAAFDA